MADGDWVSDSFSAGCLGAVTATGTRTNGLLSSAPGACSHRGRAVRFNAYWTASGDPPEMLLGAVAAAPARTPGDPWASGRLSDVDAAEIRDLLEEALEEWWATGDAREMAAENERRDGERESRRLAERAAGLAARRADLVARLSREVGSVSEMENVIRELAETERMAAALRG